MTSIPLSDNLLEQLLYWSGLKNQEEALKIAVDTYIRIRKRKLLKEMKGSIPLEIDLDKLRGDI